MKRLIIMGLASVVLTVATASPAASHHSAAQFDFDNTVRSKAKS